MNANYETKRNESHTVKNNNKTEDSKDGNSRRRRVGGEGASLAVPHKYAKQLKDSRRSNLGVKCE